MNEIKHDYNSDHYCPHAKVISLIDRRVNGTEDDSGTFADVKTIIKNQETNRSWIKGAILTFGSFIIMLFYIAVTDHNKIKDFPETYISKAALHQVVMELKQQTAAMTRIVNSPNIDSLLLYRYELKEIQSNSSFDRMMKATRGGKLPPYTKRDSIYREMMTEKAEQYLKRKQ